MCERVKKQIYTITQRGIVALIGLIINLQGAQPPTTPFSPILTEEPMLMPTATEKPMLIPTAPVVPENTLIHQSDNMTNIQSIESTIKTLHNKLQEAAANLGEIQGESASKKALEVSIDSISKNIERIQKFIQQSLTQRLEIIKKIETIRIPELMQNIDELSKKLADSMPTRDKLPSQTNQSRQ